MNPVGTSGQSISLQVLRERYRAKLILPVDLENCLRVSKFRVALRRRRAGRAYGL